MPSPIVKKSTPDSQPEVSNGAAEMRSSSDSSGQEEEANEIEKVIGGVKSPIMEPFIEEESEDNEDDLKVDENGEILIFTQPAPETPKEASRED